MIRTFLVEWSCCFHELWTGFRAARRGSGSRVTSIQGPWDPLVHGIPGLTPENHVHTNRNGPCKSPQEWFLLEVRSLLWERVVEDPMIHGGLDDASYMLSQCNSSVSVVPCSGTCFLLCLRPWREGLGDPCSLMPSLSRQSYAKLLR